MNDRSRASARLVLRWFGIGLLVALTVIGCVQLREFAAAPPPGVSAEWKELLADLRVFERRIGYRESKNFTAVTGEQETYPFCGQASRFYLPYSYEDPAIRWSDAVAEEQCREAESENDVYFGTVEAIAEVGTPVTPSMISSKLDRFIYLVIHEDCHDQFNLPYGIEEALCNVVTYRAMALFASEKFRWYSRENRSIKNYSTVQARLTRETVSHYERLAALYVRYHRKEIAGDELLKERAAMFAKAEQALELEKGELNNIVLANSMTYSRHYPYLESVFAALGGDLSRALDVFRQIDERKPSPAEVMKRNRIKDEKSVEYVRAYETAVIETIAAVLAERTTGRR
jgi:hypothetical protein